MKTAQEIIADNLDILRYNSAGAFLASVYNQSHAEQPYLWTEALKFIADTIEFPEVSEELVSRLPNVEDDIKWVWGDPKLRELLFFHPYARDCSYWIEDCGTHFRVICDGVPGQIYFDKSTPAACRPAVEITDFEPGEVFIYHGHFFIVLTEQSAIMLDYIEESVPEDVAKNLAEVF